MKPGDLLVYSGSGFFSRLIKFKTASEWTHVAVYVGDGKMREFKEFAGAQEVDFRSRNLGMIRRSKCEWNKEKADEFWQEVHTQGYDYVGLFWSFYARRQGRKNEKMFCSEFAAREHYKSTGCHAVSEETDADGVSPADLAKSVAYSTVWIGKEGSRK